MTAPATEVAGIYGLSTDAMQPQSNCLRVSQSNSPSFTSWLSHGNHLLRVLVQSLTELLESILLLVAKARQFAIDDIAIYMLCMRSESNRYGLYPAIEMAGISPDFSPKYTIKS